VLLSALRFGEECESALERAAEEPECIGSAGQAIANPQFQVAARCQERWFAGLEKLMLTPASRIGAPTGGKTVAGGKGDELDEFDRQVPAPGGGRTRRG
jgi:hypothetical protein